MAEDHPPAASPSQFSGSRLDNSIPCSGLKTGSTLQFSFQELMARRQKLLRIQSHKSTSESVKMRRLILLQIYRYTLILLLF